ncbi:MAG: transcription antitermination factor NusB [Oscillospiraceae bacterium]
MNRRKAREGAFIILFQYKFQPENIRELIDYYYKEFNNGEEVEYIEEVVIGTVEKIEEIDKKISEFSKGWTTDRMSAVSIAVIRLSVYEMLFCDGIPNTVSVNEAVAIAKEYEGDEAAPFVNGILGNIKEKC